MPAFSRQNGTETTAEQPSTAAGASVAGPDETTVAHWNNPKVDDRQATSRGPRDDTAELRTEEIAAAGHDRGPAGAVAAGHGVFQNHDPSPDHGVSTGHGRPDHDRGGFATPPPPAGPKPRASLLATLGLILGVGAALLVLSGPLLGYGMALAGLALILSIAGLRATRRRHVAGKTDALIGIVLSLAALVVGGLALTGSLSWLGTDMHPVTSLREWLDARLVDRF